jgi:uncharacterized membrane protein HdeD (DUF308 family)
MIDWRKFPLTYSGLAAIVLGVVLMVCHLAFSMTSNIVLFCGLFLIVAGVAMHVRHLKK